MNKLIAYILNYDKDDNARRINFGLPCESYIVDSSGISKSGFTHTDMPYFAGCMNKAIEHFLKTDATHILLVCSDVVGDWSSVVNAINNLPDNIGIYTPSVSGQGWAHEKPEGYGWVHRDIPFAEGMIACYKREIIEQLGYVNVLKDPHGYGIDIYLGFICQKLNLKCIIDDSIMMYHPFGSGYSQKQAEKQMKEFIIRMGAEFTDFCKSLGLCLPFYDRWYRKYYLKVKNI